MSAVIGALRAELGVQIAEFVSDMGKAADHVAKFRKRFEQGAKSLQKAGVVMSAAVTAPFLALVKTSIGDFRAQEDALAKVDASLKSTGNAAGLTRQELEDLAGALQKTTRFADEDILASATGSLLKFTNLSGENFKRAETLTLDLATAMKTELAPAADLLGKALNDPARGFKSLRSLGIALSTDQQNLIKSLVKTGDVAKAQGIILDEVSKRFGGQATAAANTTSGSLARLANQWGEVKERIGEVAVKALPPLIDLLGKVVDYLNELDPLTVEWGVKLGAIAAVVGPIVIGLGSLARVVAAIPALWAAATTAVSALAAVIAAIGWPVTAAIAAIALLAGAWVLYGDQIKAKVAELISVISAFADSLGIKINAGIAAVKLAFTNFLVYLQQFAAEVIRTVSEMVTGVGDWIGNKLSASFAAVKLTFASFLVYLKQFAADVIRTVSDMVTAVGDWIGSKLGAVFDAVKSKIEAVKGYFRGLYQAVVGGSYVPDMIDGIQAECARLDKVMVKPAKDAAKETAEAIGKIVDGFEGLFDELWQNGKLTFDDLKQAAKDLAKELFIKPAFESLKSGLSNLFQSTSFAGGFAAGGTIPAGSWGIVGEQGPEPVYAGRRALTVMPNDSMGGGSRGVTQNFYIQTPDADSFRMSQRQIARRGKMLLAA